MRHKPVLTAEQVARDQTKGLANAVAKGMSLPEAMGQAYLRGLVQGTEMMTRRGWLVIPEGE